MKFFIAGIMQGSLTEEILHPQQYRRKLHGLLAEYFPESEIYDPLANHSQSLGYDDQTAREVFFNHNRMCGEEVDVLVAFVPQASMGTAIEMWEAYRHGKVVLAISPLCHNWTIKFCSHAVYPDLASFQEALRSGTVREQIDRWQQNKTCSNPA